MAGLTLSSIPHEMRQLDQWLRTGKPELGWRGDPRLELHIGVLTASKTGLYKGKSYTQGDVMAYRVEVHRHNEDGTDTPILQRPVEEWHTIIPELVKIDPSSPMFRNTHDLVVEHNAAIDRERGTAIAEARGEMTEHLWKLVSDRQDGPNKFRGMPGLNPEKQM